MTGILELSLMSNFNPDQIAEELVKTYYSERIYKNPINDILFSDAPLTNEDLKSLKFQNGDHRRRVVKDIIKNLKSLLYGTVLSSTLDNTILKLITNIGYYDDRTSSGKEAIADLLAPTIGNIARNLNLNMDSPEIVYICGFEILKLTRSKLNSQQVKVFEESLSVLAHNDILNNSSEFIMALRSCALLQKFVHIQLPRRNEIMRMFAKQPDGSMNHKTFMQKLEELCVFYEL